MAEKRRLSTRERREPSAKRRASEATPQPQSQPQQVPSRKKASTPIVAPTPPPPPPPPPESIEKPLPIKIKDGEGLPTVDTPQPANLSSKEYQSIAESSVLLASLERSKRKWLSDGILVRYWTKPKKTKREQIEGKNPPKESMSKVGSCNIVVGPHLFDAMLYTVKDPNAPPPIQYTPPQRPMVHYSQSNTFQQYQPYPHPTPPSQQSRQPPQHSAAHSGSPQPGYQGNQQQPPHSARAPNQHPPHAPPQHPPSTPQSAQRPPPSQQPPQPPKPSPDPVIQMLATRAASDPDLKALMRVVASSKASQEQLRAFQAHIDELNAIIRAREQQQQRQQQTQASSAQSKTPQPPQTPQQDAQQPQSQPPPSQKPPQLSQQSDQQQTQQNPTPQSQPQPPTKSPIQVMQRVEVQIPKQSPSTSSTSKASNHPSADKPQTPAPQSNATPQVKQEPAASQPPPLSAPGSSITPAQPPAPGPASNAKPSSPAIQLLPNQPTPIQGAASRPGPPHPPYQGHTPTIQSRPQQYGSPTPFYRPAPPPPPPRLNYKSVVIEFTSPLTPYGSSTSGHAGSGDRYLFPEYSILEWLPGGNTVLASFLLVRKVDPNAPFPIETASDAAPSRAKGKSTSKSKKADKNKEKAAESDKEKGKGNPQSTSNQDTPATEAPKASDEKGNQKSQSAETPIKTDPAKQTKENPEDGEKTNLKEYYQPVTFRIYSANPKVLEPLSRVVKPPDEVRKYMNEIMDRAERAPEGFLALRLPREEKDKDKDEEHEVEDSRKSGTPAPSISGGVRRPSRNKPVEEGSDFENTDGIVEEEEDEEEELKDFYGAPTGLAPLGI